MKKTIACLTLYCMLVASWSDAQQSLHALKVGDTVPNIELNKFINFPNKQVSTRDFKGKLLIIDFWATWCSPCVRSLPGLDTLQNNFKGKIQLFAVTDQDESTVMKTLHLLPSLSNLRLPIIFSDTALKKLFPHNTVPHDVIIDANGIVKAITQVGDVNITNIKAMLQGKPVSFGEKGTGKRPVSTHDVEDDQLYHFSLSPYVNGMVGMSGAKEGDIGKDSVNHIFASNAPILHLYRIALMQTFSSSVDDIPDSRVILNVSDSSRFIRPPRTSAVSILNEWEARNTFCMDLKVPFGMRHSMYEQLKKELDYIFNLKSSMINIVMECVVLTGVDKSKLAPPIGNRYIDQANALWTFNQAPLDEIVLYINQVSKIMVIDETGYHDEMKLSIHPDFSSPENIIHQLATLGIKSEIQYKRLWCLKIDDKP